MYQVNITPDFEAWRQWARPLILAQVEPASVLWNQPANFLAKTPTLDSLKIKSTRTLSVSPDYLKLAKKISHARDPEPWDLMYRLLYRLTYEDGNLLKIAVDPDTRQAMVLNKAIDRDIHKMHAFVRFKKVMLEGQEHYQAWHQPEHLILPLAAPFFARRFGDKPWSIFTPDQSVHWNQKELVYDQGMAFHNFQSKDDFDQLWRAYYSAIYNPSRLNLKAMNREMNSKYWASMPEIQDLKTLVRNTPQKLQNMQTSVQEGLRLPAHLPLSELKNLAEQCRACPIGKEATQVVWGEGPSRADIMIVGEQPGDQEDLAGRPFVGPAGQLLRNLLQESWLREEEIYLTNAVKHFKFRPRGKTRLHQNPSAKEISICQSWLQEEIKRVAPKVVLALGRSAASALLGRVPQISKDRSHLFHRGDPQPYFLMVSWHPSAILRTSDHLTQQQMQQQLRQDLLFCRAMQKVSRLGSDPRVYFSPM